MGNTSDDWLRGYYCAVAIMLREAGAVTPEILSLYRQGGDAARADPSDVMLFRNYGLMQSPKGKG